MHYSNDSSGTIYSNAEKHFKLILKLIAEERKKVGGSTSYLTQYIHK